MPHALLIYCVPVRGTVRPEDLQGQKAFALFLQDLVQRQDPALADRLHAPEKAKPFTTTIMPPSNNAGQAERTEIAIRLTLLDDALSPVIAQFFLRHLAEIPQFRLGQTVLAVSRVLATPESAEPWVGWTRFEDLLAEASEEETTWWVDFATPTVFRTGNADVPLPVPRLCFQSWLTSWDKHAPQPFFQDQESRRAFLSEVVDGNVSVSYTRLSVARHRLYFKDGGTGEQGFTGLCRFRVALKRVAPWHRHLLATLVRYSFYAGTGRKTTMGMGMTRWQKEGDRRHGGRREALGA